MSEEQRQSGAKKAFGEFAPGFVHFTDDVLFGQVWQRTELSPKERSLVTVSVLAALGVGFAEALFSFWASNFKEVLVFTLIIPVLAWRSVYAPHAEETE